MLHNSCICDIRLEIRWWRDQLKENKPLFYTKIVKSNSTVKDCLRWLSCLRCMKHHFPPPSPYISMWSILEHSLKCRIFEMFVLQHSIQWWTRDKVVLTSLCRKELPTVTLSYFCQLFISSKHEAACACNSSHPAHPTWRLSSETKLPISMNSGTPFLYALCKSAHNT